MEKAYIDTLTIALRTGYEILQRGGSSLDAVEAAIRIRKGNIATPFNTDGMYRAWVTSDGRITLKIYKD